MNISFAIAAWVAIVVMILNPPTGLAVGIVTFGMMEIIRAKGAKKDK